MTLHLNTNAEPIDIPNFEAMVDPFPHYAELATRGPVLYLRSHVGLRYYGVFDMAIARDMLRDQRFSKSAEAMKMALEAQKFDGAAAGFPISSAAASNLLNTDPPDHTRLRKLVNLTFSPRRVELLRAQVESLVAGLIDKLKGKPHFDLVSEFSYPIGLTMICDILGVPTADRAEFRHLATQAMTPGAPDQAACRSRLMQYLHDLVADKRQKTDPAIAPDDQPDVLSALCAARLADDALSEEELISMSFLMLVAGHETTVGLIGNALLLLDRYDDQRRLLLDDEGLLRQTIEEVLRFDGPVHQTTMRATVEDVDIGGTVIPSGSFVRVFLAACNRDPQLAEDPNRFDITRKPTQTMAFGFGPHLCVGSHLARLEAQVAIKRLLEAFPDYAVAKGDEAIRWAGTVIRAPAYIAATPTGKGI
ncbi:cytochrome P450 [Rhizobium pusense]|uniref:cytochrome P450 family protein n=1 Tax=Agrobacterium pusense TaxID=648995 RepID=UPI001FCDD138|nr:cytochrome P450 [Agrobacterium pusense]MCJ2877401.1 cytochrome P450 [Agrobacterium pusense]